MLARGRALPGPQPEVNVTCVYIPAAGHEVTLEYRTTSQGEREGGKEASVGRHDHVLQKQ